jgi:hypothetical protein
VLITVAQPLPLQAFNARYSGRRAQFERQVSALGDPDDGK